MSDTIGKVAQDFKTENHIDIPSDYFMDWNCRNRPIQMSDKIESLLKYQTPTVCINPQLKKKPLNIDDKEIFPSVIGKPFNHPFEVYTFRKDDKTLKIQNFSPQLILNSGLENFDASSAYCNGENHLYISGGENENYEINDKFWDIDLITKEIKGPINVCPKKNHSMIFIPENYVFLVGGNDKKTVYYDNKNGEVYEWADLNKERIEPALHKVGSILFCFDNIKKLSNEKLTFEKTDLSSNTPRWEIINPEFDPSIGYQPFNQKFFGVGKDFNENIVFLGGNIDNDNSINELMNFKFSPYRSYIKPSNIPYKEFNFKEKTFLPYNKNIDFLFPDFNRQHPELVFYVKNRNKIEKMNFKKTPNQLLAENNISLRSRPRLDNQYNTSYNFNMPKLIIPEPHSARVNYKVDPVINPPKVNIEIKEPEKVDYSLKEKINNIKAVPSESIHPPEIDINVNNQKIDLPSIEIPNNDFSKNIALSNPNIEAKIKPPSINKNINTNIDTNVGIDHYSLPVSKAKMKIPHPYVNYSPRNYKRNNFEIPYVQGIAVPRFHVSVNDPGNELTLSQRGGKLSQSHCLNAPIDLGASGHVGLLSNDYYIDKNYINKTPNPNFNMSGNIPSAKFEMKTPNPDFKSPNINIEGKDINLRGPNVKIPNYDLSGSIGGSIKKPSIDGKYDIKGPEFNLPKGNIELNSPQIKTSNIELRGPNVGIPKIQMPNANLNVKGPSYDKNFSLYGTIPGTKGLKANYSMPDINMPNGSVTMRGPRAQSPDYQLSGRLPGAQFKSPNINTNIHGGIKYNSPDYELSGIIPGNKSYRTPRVDMYGNMPNANVNVRSPRFSGNVPNIKVNSPNARMNSADFSVRGPNIKGPDYNFSGIIPGSYRGPKYHSPDVNIQGPNIKGPNYGISGSIPGVNIKAPKIDMPSGNININAPKTDFKVKAPNIEIPDYNLNTKVNMPNANVNLKGPKVDLPNYNLSGSLPGVKIDPNVNIKAKSPGMLVEMPKNEIKIPSYKISAPNVKQSRIEVNAPSSNLKGVIYQPVYSNDKNFIMTGIIPGKKHSNITITNAKYSINPNEDINLGRHFHGNIDDPKYDLNCNLKGSRLAVRKGSITDPNKEIKVGKGVFDYRANRMIDEKDAKIQDPAIYQGDIKIKTPNYEIKSPNLSANYKMPSYEKNVNLKVPDINTNVDFKGPEINYNNNINLGTIPDIKAEVQNPSINLNNNLGGGIQIENKNYELNAPNIKIGIPENEIKASHDSTNLKFKPIKGDVSLNPNINASANVNYGIENKGDDMEINVAVPQNIQTSVNKIAKGLPAVGIKSSNFKASKIGVGGKFDAGNVDVTNMVSANVGVNGVKLSNRIIE